MLHLIHINDTDGNDIGPWTRAASAIRHLRREGRCDLLLHAGDVTLGGQEGPGIVALMNDLGFDALTPGNHDFDRGLSTLSAQLQAFQGAVLCANAEGFAPYIILERQGRRIALTGVVLKELDLLQPGRNLEGTRILPPAAVLSGLVPKLKAESLLVVVLSHCGLDADRELARAVPGIDLIVSAHSHHLLETPVREGDTLIVQAGCYGTHVGCVTIDADGRISEGRLISTADFQVDVAIETSHHPEDEIVGYTATDLRTDDYARETPLGNLTADLMRSFAGTDLALLRCSSVRNAYPPGPLTRRDVAGINHCGIDQVAVLELSGADLRAVLEQGARDAYYLLTTAGATVTYDGPHITDLHVNGAPCQADRVYTVACSEILARGAAGFTTMQGRPYRLAGATLQTIIENHIAAEKRIEPAIDGRLRIIGQLPRER